MKVSERIRPFVVEDGDCLRWIGGCSNGHPSIRIGGKSVLVRRALFAEAGGAIPSGQILRVTCGMPRCVNRAHWKLTTYKAVAIECGAAGLMSGHLRSAKIAAAKRAGSQAKITDADAAAIVSSDETGVVLAARYDISETTVSRIRLGKRRRNFSSPWAALGVAAA